MVGDPGGDIDGLTYVVTICGFALEDVEEIRHCRRIGGADGIRTHDLLDAIEARSQLRHGPTEKKHDLPGVTGTRSQLRHGPTEKPLR